MIIQCIFPILHLEPVAQTGLRAVSSFESFLDRLRRFRPCRDLRLRENDIDRGNGIVFITRHFESKPLDVHIDGVQLCTVR